MAPVTLNAASDAVAPAQKPSLSKGQQALGRNTVAADGRVQTVHPRSPTTAERPVPVNLSEKVPEPGVPRAVDCPSIDLPNGATDNPKERGTPLQQHIAFFDRNSDGVISPLDTYIGFRKIGFNIIFSLFAAFVINGGFSYLTQESWLPDPLFRIHTKNIHKCKHGSDMEGYDTEGRFVPQKMEEIFTKYDKEGKGYLTFKDLFFATEANRNVLDFFGWAAAKFEWGTLWLLCQRNGRITREDVRSNYDGSLFYRKEKEEHERRCSRRSHTTY